MENGTNLPLILNSQFYLNLDKLRKTHTSHHENAIIEASHKKHPRGCFHCNCGLFGGCGLLALSGYKLCLSENAQKKFLKGLDKYDCL